MLVLLVKLQGDKMSRMIIHIEVHRDDMSGRVTNFEGTVQTIGHDDLHSGQRTVKGNTKTDLLQEVSRYT